MDESPHYKLWHVPKTNVFILIKYKEKHAKKTIRVSSEILPLQGLFNSKSMLLSQRGCLAKQRDNKKSLYVS